MPSRRRGKTEELRIHSQRSCIHCRRNEEPASSVTTGPLNKLYWNPIASEPSFVSSITSEFRHSRNVAWLKEQQVLGPSFARTPNPSHTFADATFRGFSNSISSLNSFSSETEYPNSVNMEYRLTRSRSRATRSRSHSQPPPTFRFRFEDDVRSDFGQDREMKCMAIALAARQSFLKELRHRVHKAHTIFSRHHDTVSASGLNRDETIRELLESHKGFMGWIKEFIARGMHDIKKFDDLNIFVNHKKDLKYYFETSYSQNGQEHGGIFIPIPFNRALVSKFRKDQSLHYYVEKLEMTTQTSQPELDTRERQVQTDKTFLADQKNQTSHIWLAQCPSQVSSFEGLPSMCDELAVCSSISKESPRSKSKGVRSIFSSTTLSSIPESILTFSDKKSVSFKDEAEGELSASKESTETIFESSQPQAVGITDIPLEPSATEESLLNSLPASPFRVRASATEENIHKKIESIMDTLRKFKSESFTCAGFATGDKETEPQVMTIPTSQEPQPPKLEVKSDSRSVETKQPPETPEFYSCIDINANWSAAETVIPTEKYRACQDTVTRSEVIRSIECERGEQESGKQVHIILGKSFKELNDLTSSSSTRPNRLTASKSESCVSFRGTGKPPPVFTRESESYLQSQCNKLRNQLLKPKTSRIPTKVPVQQRIQVPSSNELDTQDVSTSIPTVATETRTILPFLQFDGPVSTNTKELGANSTEPPGTPEKCDRAPIKSKIPVASPTAKPKPKNVQRRRSPSRASSRKTAASKSNPCTPRVRGATPAPVPRFYTPRMTRPVVVTKVPYSPKKRPMDGGPPAAGQFPQYNRFGYKLIDGSEKGRWKASSNSASPRNRNLQESFSLSPTPTGPGLLPNPGRGSYYTTEYGASYNRSELSNSKRSKAATASGKRPTGSAPPVKRLAANFISN